MEKHDSDPLAVFNQLYKEMDEIYHLYAKRHGLSDTALWMLYSLCQSDTAYTQREFCAAWHYPPQTTNSALKNLENQGIIALKAIPGNQKNKWIVLTPKGEETAQTVILPLIHAEQRAFQDLTGEERDALLALTRKYVEHLRSQASRADGG